MSDQTVMLRMTFPGEQPTTATGVAHDWTMLERVRRAVLGGGLMWCIAAVFIIPFVPILHFVLALSFFVAGPIVAGVRFTEVRRLVSMHGSCPRCKVERDFKLGVRFNGPRTFTCDGCGNLIGLEEASSAPDAAAVPAPQRS